MKIEFVGGARTVTGSSYIVKNDDFTIMVDCGMFQGNRDIRARNLLDLIHAPTQIDALLLTHAHIDHSGLIPKLVKNGFNGKIYATKATTDLCTVMLPDSAHINEMDTKWINRKNRRQGRELIDPLYSIDDAEESIQKFIPVSYGEIIQINRFVRVRFRDAGHILGSSFIEMWIEEGGKETKLVFSGDVGQKDQVIIRDPENIDEADILLIESTYGNRLHKGKEDTYNEFKQIILDSYNQKGNIIIPAFAVERTQEIIYILIELFKNGDIPEIPVYIDSPLAISATEIFRRNEECFDDETRNLLLSGESPLDFPNIHFTRSTEESVQLNENAHGSIIISASGMCTAGRIKYHLMHNLYKPESSVIFVGYQAEGTIGRRLVDGAKKVRLYGEDTMVNAKIHTLGGFSAHADSLGLLEWTRTIKNPKLKVFVVHGEEKASLSLAENIRSQFSYETYVPQWGEIIDLKTMRSVIASYGVVDSYATLDREIEALTSSYESLVKQYYKARDENRLMDMEKLKDDFNDVREMFAIIMDDL